MKEIAMFMWIVIAVIAVLVIWFVATYNRLQRLKVYISEAWSGIDVQLKRKANILPNLVDVLKMQMKYEGDLLTNITAARSGIVNGSNADRMKADNALTKMMPNIYAVAENYPQLASSSSFTKLMSEIKDCEDKITYSRNRYNIAVAEFNMALVTIPSNIVAGMMSLQKAELFEISAQSREDADNMRIKDI